VALILKGESVWLAYYFPGPVLVGAIDRAPTHHTHNLVYRPHQYHTIGCAGTTPFI
jgi:hypothetical protein